MNLILIIYGALPMAQYEAIRDDLVKQFVAKGLEPPFFVNLPADYTGIEAVWIEKPEGERTSDSVVGDFRAMEMMAG